MRRQLKTKSSKDWYVVFLPEETGSLGEFKEQAEAMLLAQKTEFEKEIVCTPNFLDAQMNNGIVSDIKIQRNPGFNG